MLLDRRHVGNLVSRHVEEEGVGEGEVLSIREIIRSPTACEGSSVGLTCVMRKCRRS